MKTSAKGSFNYPLLLFCRSHTMTIHTGHFRDSGETFLGGQH